MASPPPLRTAPGMRERAPGVWEMIVEGGSDPVTGKRRQVSRVFRGNLRDAKKARAELLVEVGKGRHTADPRWSPEHLAVTSFHLAVPPFPASAASWAGKPLVASAGLIGSAKGWGVHR